MNLSIGQLSVISFGILAYVVLGRKIYLERGVGQNILSYTLWVILDVVQYLVTKSVGGESALLLLVFMLGGASIALLLYKLKVRGKLKKNDYYVISGVIMCIFAWQIAKAPILAIVFASIAQFVAGIPLLEETWKNPKKRIHFTQCDLPLRYCFRCRFYRKLQIRRHALSMCDDSIPRNNNRNNYVPIK